MLKIKTKKITSCFRDEKNNKSSVGIINLFSEDVTKSHLYRNTISRWNPQLKIIFKFITTAKLHVLQIFL